MPTHLLIRQLYLMPKSRFPFDERKQDNIVKA